MQDHAKFPSALEQQRELWLVGSLTEKNKTKQNSYFQIFVQWTVGFAPFNTE